MTQQYKQMIRYTTALRDPGDLRWDPRPLYAGLFLRAFDHGNVCQLSAIQGEQNVSIESN